MSSIRYDAGHSWALIVSWLTVCAALTGGTAALFAFGDAFAWERQLKNIPALWLAGGLCGAGLVFTLIVPLIHQTGRARKSAGRSALWLVLATGLIMRLIMVPSMPALEDDFYRYLWDGAVTAKGYNPYTLPPMAARTGGAPQGLQELAGAGTLVLDRVNHPELKTIYPPVSMAVFTLAHWIEPWSLRAWRGVCLIGECLSLAFILMLLASLGRSPLWVALYWLNPLVVKELMNSAHMEAVVLPFVLGALLLLVRRHPVSACAAIGMAIGAKLWPIMLLPLFLRPLLGEPRRLLLALMILALMAVAWTLPPLLGGLGSDSGFIAYATSWQTNSALFQSLQYGAGFLLSDSNIARETPGMIIRITAAVAVAGFAVWLVRDGRSDPQTVVGRAALIVLALFLLSPAQFPWYAAWLLIFAPLAPLCVHIAMTVFLPLYYVSFYLIATGGHEQLNAWLLHFGPHLEPPLEPLWGLVWVEWLPIWGFLLVDIWRAWRQPFTAKLSLNRVGRI